MTDKIETRGVKAAERARADALVRADIAAVAALLGDDLTYVHATGRVEGKAELLAGLETGTRYLVVEQADLVVREFEDAAVLTGRARIVLQRSVLSSPVELETSFTQVWTTRSGRWALVAHHASLSR